MSSLLTSSTASHRHLRSSSTHSAPKHRHLDSFTSKIPSFSTSTFQHLKLWLDRWSPFTARRSFSKTSLEHHASSPVWKYSRVALCSSLFIWSIYCTIRYFFSITVYDNDRLRCHIAIGLGTLSILAVLFFGIETMIVYALAMQVHMDKQLRNYVHFLTYFASFLLIISSIVNIIFIVKWRRPSSSEVLDRVIQGRCTWDVDAIWTGTGMSCAENVAQPFGIWLGAGICRLVLTLLLVNLYFLTSRCFPRPEEEPTQLPLQAGSQMDELTLEPSTDGARILYHPKNPTALSFTGAGQVLSRLEPDSDDDEEGGPPLTKTPDGGPMYSSLETNDPDHVPELRPRRTLSGRSSYSGSLHGPRPRQSSGSTSSSTTRSNTTQSSQSSPHSDVIASQLQSLLNDVERETQAGMLNHNDYIQSILARPSVQMMGRSFDKLSTIESEEMTETPGSPRLYSPFTPTPTSGSIGHFSMHTTNSAP